MLDELKTEQQLYILLHRIFAREVDAAFIADMAAVAPPEEKDALSSPLAMIINAVKAGDQSRDALLEELAVEYASLFIGPRNPPAIPFASFYLSESRALMTEETIEVRKIYLANSMVVENLYSTPDDHIAIELEFLMHLTAEMIEAFTAGDEKRCKELETTKNSFIVNHMQMWIPNFVDAIEKAVPHPLYKGAALLLEEVIMNRE